MALRGREGRRDGEVSSNSAFAAPAESPRAEGGE